MKRHILLILVPGVLGLVLTGLILWGLSPGATGTVAAAPAATQQEVFWEEDFSQAPPPDTYYITATADSGLVDNESFLLTQDDLSQGGRIFYLTPIPMTQFSATFSLYLGDNDGGADGAAFIFCPSYDYPQLLGGLLDASCPEGYFVAFDTYEDTGSSDDRVYLAFENESNRLESADVSNLEDDGWHDTGVIFNQGTLTVTLDGSDIIAGFSISGYEPFFGYFGFSAATGLLHNEQRVDDIQVQVESISYDLVEGTVTDVNTGWPLYAEVDTNSPAGSVWTDPVTGYYSIMLPEGVAFNFEVSAWVAGYVPEMRVVGPLTGDTIEDFALDVDVGACEAPGYEEGTGGTFYDFEGNNGGFVGTNDWEWGTYSWAGTCGTSYPPPGAYSGNDMWGTVLNGCYNNLGASNDLSFVVDLSSFSAAVLSWWDWYDVWETWDHGEVYVNGNMVYDRAASYLPPTEWENHTIDISAYAGSPATIEFRMWATTVVERAGWYIDDVYVAEPPCFPQPGGLVVGNVYDNNTLDGLIGALVESDEGEMFYTEPTQGDPNVDDGFYTLFASPGDHDFTTSLDKYADDTEIVSAIDGGTVGQDFYLDAPWLAPNPDVFDVIVALGYSRTEVLTLDNMGGVDADFKIIDVDTSFIPPPIGNVIKGSADASSNDEQTFPTIASTPIDTLDADVLLIQDLVAWGYPAITTILNDNGIPYDLINSSQIGSWDFSPYKMIIIPSVQGSTYNINFNNYLSKFETFIDYGGLMLMSFCEQSSYIPYRLLPFGGTNNKGSESYNYIIDENHPIFAGVNNPYYGSSASHSYLSDLLPDDIVLVTGGSSPGGNTIMIERYGGNGLLVAGGQTFEFGWGYGQGAGIILENMIPWYYFAFNAVWLFENPINGTVPAMTPLDVQVTFDASVPEVPDVGDYLADMRVNVSSMYGNSPYGTLVIPVTMTVVTPYAPVVSFTVTQPLVAGFPATFMNTSDPGAPPADEFLWDFGDGMTMTAGLEDVTHVYADPGTYTVTLFAENPIGDDTYSMVVDVIPPARLQVAHLAPFAMDPGTAVTVTLNGTPALTDFAYGGSTAYIDLIPGMYDVVIYPAGSPTPAITATVDLMEGMHYTAIAIGDGVNQNLSLLVLVDDLTPPATGKFKLRIGHLAPFAAGSVTADVRLDDGTVILDDVDFGEVAPYLELDAGEYDLKITTPDGATTLIDLAPLTFSDGDILSAFATGDGVNQPLGAFGLPADAVGFFLPLEEGYMIYLPIINRND